MPSQPEIRILNTPADLFQAAANEFAKLASDAVSRRGRFCVALSGGSTPKTLYALLATIAGIFYGSAWRKTGSIFPAAIVHALVDTTWHLLFRTL